MSIRKILFLAISWISLIILILIIIALSNKKESVLTVPKELKIWISEGTTESYDSLIEWFKLYAPEFKNTNIVFEKKTTDPVRYRTLLLSTMSDGMSPDIFMIGAWEDTILESRIEPVPEEYIDIGYFEKEYDDIFLSLITSTWSKGTLKRSILGIPLGFETMGIFYNKNLIREVPKTWNELDLLHQRWVLKGVFVSNLWLWPRYTPNASNLVSLFLVREWTDNILDIWSKSDESIASYIRYKDAVSTEWAGGDSDIYSPILTLDGQRDTLDLTKTTTLDMFVQWNIGMIFWYPSLITELEKSDKRTGSSKSIAWVVLTAKIPLDDTIEPRENVARYSYFGVSKWSKNPSAALEFLKYLMTPDAQRRFIEQNPHLIAAQRSFWSAQKTNKISSIFNRAGIDAFIPDIDEGLSVFNYGLKAEFDELLSEYLDRKDIMDISNIIGLLSIEISCNISPYDPSIKNQENCEKR